MNQVTIFCVETFGPSGRRLDPRRLSQHGDRPDAMAVARDEARRRAGVLVFSVTGDPFAGVWQEPQIVARYGKAPQFA